MSLDPVESTWPHANLMLLDLAAFGWIYIKLNMKPASGGQLQLHGDSGSMRDADSIRAWLENVTRRICKCISREVLC